MSPEKIFLETHIINPLLTKLVRSRWLDIGLTFPFMDLDSVSIHKHGKKRTWPISNHVDLTLGQ